MIFSPFTSPRRLALLVVFAFIGAIFFISNSGYREYIPKYDVPWRGSPPGGQEEQKGASEKKPGPPGETLKSETMAEPSVPPYDAGDYDWSTPKVAISTASTVATTSTSTSTSKSGTSSSSKSVYHPSDFRSSASPTNTPSPLPHMSHEQVQEKIQQLMDWQRPTIGGHWPPYDWYQNRNYDPNRWEGFDWDHDFYINNGIKGLKKDKFVEAQIYNPYPAYNSKEWKEQWRGEYVACEGARGKLLNESLEDAVKAYPEIPTGFPKAVIGDADVTGVDTSYCFDRYHRYGPYGYGQTEAAQVYDWQRPIDKPDWTSVKWGSLQDHCVAKNKERWYPNARDPVELAPGKDLVNEGEKALQELAKGRGFDATPSYRSRTALLIRTWEGYKYTPNDVEALRALITELSLSSGGEYQVFLFVNLKDNNLDIFNNPPLYREQLQKNVPKEFWDISILWNEKICQEWYPKVGDWQVYWHQFMPLQWFSKTHPEFDFVWNWETDARFTGNHYQFLEAVSNFSKRAPRKYQWERSQRFYFPSVHGTYEQWQNDTHSTIEHAMREDSTYQPVWGPMPYNTTLQQPIGPKPPHSMESDSFEWGVDEEADLITLQPIWDPRHTEWTFRNKMWNFVPGKTPHFTKADPLDDKFDDPEFLKIPRRVYINTLSRLSRRQLHAMHLENSAGRTTQTEMWPATVALHHGLKAVYAPHPIWTDRKWPNWYLDAVFNADGNKSAQWGQQYDSPYNHDREHNFGGWSWYYQSEFPISLFRRWLGWKDEKAGPLGGQLGGKEFEDKGSYVPVSHFGEAQGGESMVEVGGQGRMCLPPMLLHPVKDVVEKKKNEKVVSTSRA